MKMRKFLASMAAVAMAVCSTASVTAFAESAVSAGDTQCELCGKAFSWHYSNDVSSIKTYEETYGVPSLDNIESDEIVDSTEHGGECGMVYDDNPNLLICFYSTDDEDFEPQYDAMICLSCVKAKVEVYKAAHNSSDIGEQSSTTNVKASVSSTCTILIPESITLTKNDNIIGSGEYTKDFEVTVKGDVPEEATVTITADDPTLTATGAKDVTATLIMDKTQWNRTDIVANDGEGTVSNCNLKATLTPGTWTGTMTYNIVLTGKFELTA